MTYSCSKPWRYYSSFLSPWNCLYLSTCVLFHLILVRKSPSSEKDFQFEEQTQSETLHRKFVRSIHRRVLQDEGTTYSVLYYQRGQTLYQKHTTQLKHHRNRERSNVCRKKGDNCFLFFKSTNTREANCLSANKLNLHFEIFPLLGCYAAWIGL